MRGLKLIIALLSWLFFLPLSGQDLWNKVIITGSEDQAYSTAASDFDNSVVVAGMVSSNEAYPSPIRPYSGGASDGFVAKYDDTGNLLWATYIGTDKEDACGDVVVDEMGNIYITGYVEDFSILSEPDLTGDGSGFGNRNDAFVCKLSPTGVIQWFEIFGGTQEDSGVKLSYFRGKVYMVMNSEFSGVLIDGSSPTGSVALGNLRHYILMAIDAETGSRDWFWFIGSEANDYASGKFLYPQQQMNRIDLEVDGSGVYVGAILFGQDAHMSSNEGVVVSEPNISVDTASDPFIIKFDHKGQHLFTVPFTNSLNDHFYLKIALDCDRVYATVNTDYASFGSDYDIWLFSMAKSDGTVQFNEQYSTNFFSSDDAIIYDLESEGKGRLLAVGTMRQTLSYTQTSGFSGSISSSGYNFFLLNIRASDGRIISSHEGGGTGDDAYHGISVSDNSTVSVVGLGRQGDEIAGANTGNLGSLNSSTNILIRATGISVVDLSSCCREAGLIKNVVADPEYFCNGEIVTLTAEGDYDDIAWFIVDGPTWTPIPATGPINATADVNIQAIGKLSCGIADTSAVLILMHDKTDPIFSNCPINLSVDTDPGTCEYLYSFGTPVATDNCAPPTVSRTDVNGWNSGDALPVGFHVFSYLATDEGGGTATCSYQVSVKDGEAPSAVGPANVNVIVDGDCQYAVPDIRPLLSLSDNCTAEANLFFSQLPISGTLVNGDSSVNFTVIDEADNVYNGSLSLTAVDTISPQFGILPVLVIKPVDAGCNYVLQDFTTTFSGTDNCSASNVLTLSQSPAAGTVFNGHGTVQEVTLTLSDESGNTSTGSFDIQLVDNIAPIADNVLIAASVSECSYTETIIPTATDNCAGTVFGTTTDPLTYSTQGTYTINWLYEDGNGNSTMQTQLITIDDTTAPVPDAPSLPTITGECSVNVATTPTAMDNCVGTLTASSTDPMTYSTQGSYTITWLYEDGNGNSTTQTQTVIVNDTTTPVPDVPSLSALTGDCSVSLGVMPTATDNCAGTLTATSTDPMTYSTQGTYTITWLFEDGNGNSTTQTQTVIVDDATAPVPDVPSLPALTGDCSVSVGVIPTATDNCAGTLTASTTDPMIYSTQGTYTITWLYEDGNGNSTTQTQTIIVDDTTAPLPDAATLPTASGECSVTVSTIPAATDNCSGSISGTTGDPLTYNSQGTYTITWLYEDGNGNTATQTQTVIVDDTMAPIPDLATLPTASGECMVVVSTIPTATDNCSGSISGTTGDPLTYNSQGTYTITWTFDDGNGNTSQQSQTVIVDDTTAPLPDAATLPTASGECSVTVSSIPTATDNCSGSISGTTSDPLTYSGQGTYTITWLYEDGNGNSTTQTQTVIVDDTTAPVPDSATLPTASGECSVTVSSIPTATDNCSGAISGTTSDPLTYGGQGTYTITWLYEDGNGNSTTQTQIVIVDDTMPPVPDVPTLPTASGECLVTVTPPTATDGCQGLLVGTTLDPLTYNSQGSYTITWSYDDGNGNSISQMQTVIVDDLSAPIPDLGSLPTLIGECSVTASLATATDNCQGAIVGSTMDPLTYIVQGTYIITWTYEDGNGNSSQQAQTIIVDDTSAPVPDAASLPVLNGECSVEVLSTPTATDDCEGAIIGTTSDPLSYSSQGTYTITWTFDDGNGNISQQSQTIVVNDTTGPVPNVASLPDVSGECMATVNAPSALDNCEGVIIATTTDPITYTTQGTFSITWIYDDGHGNTSTQDQTVIVQDTEDPIVLTSSSTIQRTLDANCAYVLEDLRSLISVTDACDTDLDIVQNPSPGLVITGDGTLIALTFIISDDAGNNVSTGFTLELEDITAPAVSCPAALIIAADAGTCGAEVVFNDPIATDACGTASVIRIDGLALNSGDIFPVGMTVLTYQAADESGNTSTCTLSILVQDQEGPIISGPTADEPAFNENCGTVLMDYAGLLTYSDGCTPFADLIATQSPVVGATITGPTLVTVTIIDGAGNASDHDILVTPQDVTPPVFNAMDDLSRSLGASCQYLMEDFTGLIGVSDNCSPALTLSQFPLVNTPFFGHGTIVPVTIYAEDASGNIDSLTFSIGLEDNTPPSIICPNDTTVYSSVGSCEVFIDMEVAVAMDACQTVSSVNNFNGTGDASDFYPLGNTIISWSTTDDQNFLSTCVQMVTVIDTVAPVIEEISEVVVDMFGCTYELGDFTSYVMASDNCTEAADLTIDQDLIGGQISGPTYLEFIVTDASGNSSISGFNVVPVNVVAPVMDCYGTLTAVLPEGDCEMEVNIPAPLATDDCGDATVTNTDNGTNSLTLTLGLGDHDVTWIATDAEGNSSECLITVTVTPEVPVNMVCPENISTVASATECGADLVIGQPEVNGFCSFVLSNDFNGTSDASGVYGVGTTEVIFTATGSTEISCSFTVEILDITVPTVICPQAIEQCGNTVDVDTPEWSDACGISSLVNDFNGLEDASGEYPSGETIITWTATDLSGNTNSCTTMVNITEIDIIATAGPDAILDFYFDHQLQATLPTGATGTWSSENEALSFSDVNDPQATVTGLALGNNVLTWTVDHGLCGVMEDEVNVLTREFLIPNGFSPNGDNVNDTYVIRGLATLGGVAIQVFDRWGLEVYASDDYDNSWDGVSPMGKTLPTGTYFYIITLKERNEILRGSLELKR